MEGCREGLNQGPLIEQHCLNKPPTAPSSHVGRHVAASVGRKSETLSTTRSVGVADTELQAVVTAPPDGALRQSHQSGQTWIQIPTGLTDVGGPATTTRSLRLNPSPQLRYTN